MEIWLLLKHWQGFPSTISTLSIINQLTNAVPRWQRTCTTKVCMRAFPALHWVIPEITRGNFKLHEKQENKSMLIKWKKKIWKKEKASRVIGRPSKMYQRERGLQTLIWQHWKGLGKALTRAVAVVVSAAAFAPFLTSSHCARREFPGVNPGKAAKGAACTALKLGPARGWTN